MEERGGVGIVDAAGGGKNAWVGLHWARFFLYARPTLTRALPPPFSLSPHTRPLSPESCTPLNLLIQPGPAYALVADPAVIVPTLKPASGLLQLGVRAFNSSAPLVLRVVLPPDALSRVVASGGGGITVAPGFNSSSLTLVNTGPGTLYVSGWAGTGTHVAILNSGSGAVAVDSPIRTASVEGGGAGATFLRGVSRSVAVDLGGMARAIIEPASADAVVTGATAGMASVQLSAGRCGVVSANGGFFGPPCVPLAPGVVQLPMSATSWSCGMAVQVDGVLGCEAGSGRNAVVLGGAGGGGAIMSGGGTGFTTFTSNGGGGGGFVSTSGGGGNGMVMTSTSGGGGGSFISTGGGGGGTSFISSSSTGGGGGGGGVVGTGGNFYTINPDGFISQQPVVRTPVCSATAAEVAMTLE